MACASHFADLAGRPHKRARPEIDLESLEPECPMSLTKAAQPSQSSPNQLTLPPSPPSSPSVPPTAASATGTPSSKPFQHSSANPAPSEDTSSLPGGLTASNVFDLNSLLHQQFGMEPVIAPPQVPFKAPPSFRWVMVSLPCPHGTPTRRPTPILFPLGTTALGLSVRDQVCLGRVFRFWQLCERINERAEFRRERGLGPPAAWSTLMTAVGHDKENRDFLWALDDMWRIRFSPTCWVKFGDDTSEIKWFEKYVA